MRKSIIVFVLIFLNLVIFSTNTSQTSLASVFGFIEKMSGSRNFQIELSMKFDVDDLSVKPPVRKSTVLGFELMIQNLDIFQIKLLKPEIFEGIIITYDKIKGTIKYSYEKSEIISKIGSDVFNTSDVIVSILDFLSTPVFDVNTTKTYTEFIPKNSAVLSRFGVIPIKVRLYVEKDTPKKIVLMNDKTDETISIELKKFNAYK